MVFFGIVGSVSAYTDDGTAFFCGNSTMNSTEICDDCESALNNNTYSIVYLNESIHNVSGTCIVYPSNFQNKIFDGQEYTMSGDGTNIGIYLNSNNYNVIIQNFNFSNFDRAIRNYGNLVNVTVSNNTFSASSTSAIFFTLSGGFSGENITITNNNFSSSQNDGFFMYSETGYYPTNLKIYENNFFNISDEGIHLDITRNSLIYSNNFTDVGTSIYFRSSSGQGSQNNSIYNNRFLNPLSYGIYSEASYNSSFFYENYFELNSSETYGIRFNDCINLSVYDNNFDLNADATSYLYGVYFVNNSFLNLSRNNFTSIGNYSRAIYLQNGNNNNIYYNQIYNISRTGIYGETELNDTLFGNNITGSSFEGVNLISFYRTNNSFYLNNTFNSPYNIAMHLGIGKNNTIVNNTMPYNSSFHGGLYICIEDSIIEDNSIWNLDFCAEYSAGYYSGRNNLVQYNNITNAVELKGGVNNTIIYNTIGGALGAGNVYCDNDVYGNNISYNNFTLYGITLGPKYKTYNNTISFNNFYDIVAKPGDESGYQVPKYPIHLKDNSTNNSIYGNTGFNIITDYLIYLNSSTSNNKGCGNNGSINDNGTGNYVSNLTQSCYVWQCENLNDEGRLNGNGTYILGSNVSGNACFNFSVNNTKLDGKGYTINGSTYGLRLNNVTGTSINNLTLLNFLNPLKTYSTLDFVLQNIIYGSSEIYFNVTSLSNIDTIIINWTNSLMNWSEYSSNSTAVVSHEICNLTSGSQYQVYYTKSETRTLFGTYTVDTNGCVSFDYNQGYSTIIFDMQPYIAPTTSPTSSSSSSSSGGYSPQWKMSYIVGGKEFLEGYTKQIGSKERFRFKIGNKTDYHHVGVLEVTNNSVKIEVASEPQNAILLIDDERKFDVNEDDYYDVLVKLNGINETKADLTIREIYEEVNNESEAVEQEKEEKANEVFDEENSFVWVYILVAVLIIVFVGVGINKKKK